MQNDDRESAQDDSRRRMCLSPTEIAQALSDLRLDLAPGLPGMGRDTAVVTPPPGHALVVAIDTMVCGVHFPADTPPGAVGHKVLAVNLSDLAAMGAEPAQASLCLAFPEADRPWLREFGAGLLALARRHGVTVCSASFARGPFTATVQVYGHLPPGSELRRAGAAPGDLVYVTGTVGDAGLALARRFHGLVLPAADAAYAEGRLARPEPRLAAGMALRGLAGAAIDISDGLAADLGHVLDASGAGASLQLARLPLSAALRRNLDPPRAWELALSSGDDYELLFTVPPAKLPRLEARLADLGCPATRIGVIEARRGLRCVRPDGTAVTPRSGYLHFS